MNNLEVDSEREFIMPYINSFNVSLSDDEVERVVNECRTKIIYDIMSITSESYCSYFSFGTKAEIDAKGKKRNYRLCINIFHKYKYVGVCSLWVLSEPSKFNLHINSKHLNTEEHKESVLYSIII